MATEPKAGRPSDYMPEVADDICSLLSSGESLLKVCKRPGMPDKSTVFRWLAKHEDFRDKYAKATEARADSIFEEIFEIADNAIPDAAEVAKARLRVDTRK
ncbi:ubiquitin carboxyl-hydrolase, partial [Escherichia coli]